jgi:beta-glucanase (GH16 family)
MRILQAAFIAVVFGIAVGAGCKKTPTEPAAAVTAPDSTALSGWSLVWHDEFNDSTINSGRWNFEVGGGGWGNNELEFYTSRPRNAFIENGWLVIAAWSEAYQGRSYTSARMTTFLKGDWLYGRVDVKAQMPYGQGLWPAIWMMPTDSYYGTWPASGEMDIMELLGHDPIRVYGTVHWRDSTTAQHKSQGTSYVLPGGKSFAGGFHLFSYEWSADSLKWLVDGVRYQSQPNRPPFDKRFFLILNVAVGGTWPGNPSVSTVFPQFMIVDYVRVYSR